MDTKRILVVDDEAGVRESLAANLELEGYTVVEARDGAEAVELFSRGEFDVVVTDVRMPRMNGVDAFRHMKQLRPGVAVVLMTAFAVESLLEAATGEGAYTVVTKPFSMDHLFRIVARAVGRPVILVVDGAADSRSALDALGAAGLRAVAVHDEPAAMERVARADVDVCVLDLGTAGIDALAVHARLRQADSSIPVIALSGAGRAETIHRFMTQGGYACLRRPFEPAELVRAIARARGAAARD